MSTAVHRSTPSLSVPQTQNTAPVLEFNCLYTHDLRRKQKRWQDGFLRYHTFNKRIMVYDVPRNFVGDMHWKGDAVLQEGDEMTLDKGGALVQVADIIGRTETDLTELLNSARKAPGNNGSSPLKPSHPSTRPGQPSLSRPSTQSKHKSLNALLGTPRGPLGKATLPVKSPFEQRYKEPENSEWEFGRPPKRPRLEHVAQESARQPGIQPKGPDLPLWARTADSVRKVPKQTPVQNEFVQSNVINLIDDEPVDDRFLPGFSSDVLDGHSTPKNATPARKPHTTVSSSPGFQTCQKQAPPRDLDQSNWIPKETNRNVSAESARQKPRHSREETEVGPTLRLAATAPKKKMLVCQEQMSQRSKASKNVDSARDSRHRPQSEVEENIKPKTAKERLEERLARINNKSRERPTAKSSREQTKSPEQPESELQQAIEILAHRPDRSTVPTEQAPAKGREEPEQAPTIITNDPPAKPQPVPEKHPNPVPVSIVRAPKPLPTTTTKQPERSHTAPPSPSRAASAETAIQPAQPQFKPRLKKHLQRAVSLNTAASGTSTVILSKPFRAPGANLAGGKETEVPTKPPPPPDPWSREAFDLFDWRPPGWDEEGWKIGDRETV